MDAAVACKNNELAVSWNQQGPKGDIGATGPTGATGATGPTGPAAPRPDRSAPLPER